MADSKRRIELEVGYNSRDLLQGIPPSQAAIRALTNEVRSAKAEFALGATTSEQYAASLRDTQNSAITLANGLGRSSDEYARLTSLANQAQREIDRVGQEFTQVATQANQAEGSINRFNASAQNTSGAARAVGLLSSGLGALGLAFGAQQVVQYVQEIGQITEQAGRSQQAVTALAGSVSNANAIIGGIEKAGNGAISRLDATNFAARALALGLADTAQEAALFTRTVTVLGASVGKDATESFDQLQLAIANLSYERLDSLGISASRVRERVAELNKTGLETSESFRIAVLDEAAERLQTLDAAGFQAATSTEKLQAAQENLSLTLGQTFAPAYDAAVGALTTGVIEIEKNIEKVLELERALSILLGTSRGFGLFQEDVREFAEASKENVDATNLLDEALARVESRLNAIPLDDTQAQVRLVADAFVQVGREAGLTETEIIALYEATGGTRAELVLAGDAARITGGSFVEMAGKAQEAAFAELGAETASEALALAFDYVDRTARGAAVAIGLVDAAGIGLNFSSAIGQLGQLGAAFNALNAARAGMGTGGALESAQANLGIAQSRLDNSSGLAGRINAYAGVLEAQNAVSDAEEAIQNEYEQSARAAEAAGKRAASAANKAAREQESAAKKAAREQERLLKQIEDAYRKTYDEAYGRVDRVLSFQGGVRQFDDLLDRTGVGRMENYSDETIRQLEDVRDRALEGTRSQWIEKFLGLDDASLEVVAAKAERRIRDLQSGLATATLDPARVEADVRRQIEIEREAKAFRDKITKSLVGEYRAPELNSALNSVLGETGETTGTDLGSTINDALMSQFAASEAQYIRGGELIGQGIKKGIPLGLAGIGDIVSSQILTETVVALEGAVA